jgi:serine/threonine-protein kinase
MKKTRVWDVVIGLGLTLGVLAAYLCNWSLFEGAELKFYDLRSKLRQNLLAADEVVLVSIDDNSLAAIGRWPWPRWRLAALVDRLSTAGAKVVGLDIVLSEDEYNPGLAEIKRLQDRYEGLLSDRAVTDKKKVFDLEFSSAMAHLDSDSKLEASLQKAGNVVLPMFFSQGGKLGSKPEPLPPAVSSFTVTHEVVAGALEYDSPDGLKATFPIVRFASACAGIGHVSPVQDSDGVLRREIPVFRYGESYFPSYALELVMAYSGLSPHEAVFKPGREVRVGNITLPLDEESRMLISFNGPDGTFRSFPYQDVMNDKVSLNAFAGKIVVVGLTASAVATLFNTPLANNFPPTELTANIIENILHRRFLLRPPWAERFELGLLVAVGLFIMFLLPRLRALSGLAISIMLLAGLAAAGVYPFARYGYWIKVAYPAILLVLAYLIIISKRFFVTEKGKELVEASAIETNKMLGLSFQGQGMLDLAFEKFRLCPLDDNLKDTLYNLALDFERKRQFAKAAAVLGHIQAKDPKYKDIAAKITMLKAAADGAVFGGIGGAKKEGTVVITGSATKPTLGRYEIEKELGRGAMGIVYLGRDPKINRQVAIKTMVLEEGSDSAAAKEIKERFFREAESAGTLNHPNIVRIFDAGEEADVAFIAMELLEGHDFLRYTQKEGLLPVSQALEYVAVVADALDYAHAQGIVHRDIKPANIMLLKDGTIRVADFGIARITASSKTATGTVLGTPSYMSPEQVAGKKVDGRSDIFSLTVALYEFLTGERPFKGGEGLGTLLFQIANDPHPDPRAVRPDLPPCVVPILDRGLAKDPEQRYARGSLMAADLRACAAAVKSGVSTTELTMPLPQAASVTTKETPDSPQDGPAFGPPSLPSAVPLKSSESAGSTIRLEAPQPAVAPAPIAAEPVLILPEPTSELVRDVALPPGAAEAPASEGTIRLPPRGTEAPASDGTFPLPPDQEKP